MKKRDEKIIMIGKGKFCGSPCYAYNKNILLHCPKCNGNTTIEVENAYEKQEKYNEYKHKIEEVEVMVEKDICVRLDFMKKLIKSIMISMLVANISKKSTKKKLFTGRQILLSFELVMTLK